MRRAAFLLSLLIGCAPGAVFSRAALPDETPFDAEVKAAGVGNVAFRDVGAIIVVSNRTDAALKTIQCLACHRIAEHPPVPTEAPRHAWTKTKGD